MLDCVGVMHFRLKSENAPPLWGDFKEPLSQKGFFELFSFGIFPLQKQRKVHKTRFPYKSKETYPLSKTNIKHNSPLQIPHHCAILPITPTRGTGHTTRLIRKQVKILREPVAVTDIFASPPHGRTASRPSVRSHWQTTAEKAGGAVRSRKTCPMHGSPGERPIAPPSVDVKSKT